MSNQTYDADGTLVEEWDDESRTYTDHRTDPPTTRPYTDDENAEADARAAAALRAANEQALRDGLAAEIDRAIERQDTSQAVIDTPNAEIKANPQLHIIALARATKRQDRAIIRLARLAGNLLDSSDTGTD